MPCWQVRTTTVELKAADKDALIAALQSEYGEKAVRILGDTLTVEVSPGVLAVITDGKIAINEDYASEINRVKRAYSEQIIRQMAKRKGWTTIADKTNSATSKTRNFQVKKRTIGGIRR